MRAAYGFVQTTRLIKSLGVALLLTFASGSVEYGIGTFLFLTFSFAFNDWIDAPKDKIGHPNRAIPSGKLTRQQALYISMALFTIGVSWSIFFLSDYIRGFSIIYFFSILYSWILKPNIPIFATPLWSWAIAILFLQPFSADLSAYLGVAIIVYAYELLLDYRDRKADKEFCKTPTLSNILGKSTQIIAGTLFLSGIALLA